MQRDLGPDYGLNARVGGLGALAHPYFAKERARAEIRDREEKERRERRAQQQALAKQAAGQVPPKGVGEVGNSTGRSRLPHEMSSGQALHVTARRREGEDTRMGRDGRHRGEDGSSRRAPHVPDSGRGGGGLLPPVDGAGGKEPRQRDRDMLSSVSTLRRDDLMGHDGVGRGGARLDMPDMSGISDRMSHHIGEREGGRGLVPGHGLVGPGRVPTEMSR
jgi:hypothetical protein